LIQGILKNCLGKSFLPASIKIIVVVHDADDDDLAYMYALDAEIGRHKQDGGVTDGGHVGDACRDDNGHRVRDDDNVDLQ
jgi:hypothetical protein